MSCQHCDATQAIFTLTAASGDYIINSFATEGDAITFSATEDSIDRKYDSLGNILSAGSRIKRVTINMRATCDNALDLWTDFKNPENSLCGSAIIVDNCCTNETFTTADVISMTRPTVGDTVSYFDIEILGILQ